MADDGDSAQTLTDPMDPARARALQATLGQAPSIVAGDPLPPFAHQVYFWDPQVPDRLGRDGHPARGGFIPDMGLPRRMWAAGRLVFHKPLRAGIRAERLSRIEAVTRKQGRSGPLAFVTLRHDIRQAQALALTEFQELVYREDGVAAEPPAAPDGAEVQEERTFDPTLLFRYSALTFNGHRIHYDADYAREVEGYAGLVVHGPLHAHLLMDMAQAQLGALRNFQYRATSPVICGERVRYCWRAGRLWAAGTDGRLVMEAQAS